MIETKVEHGVESRIEVIPAGMVEILTYVPYSTPWDFYGWREQHETIQVLKRVGIEGLALRTRERRLNPQGTGPRGRVRFGDDMLPGIYRVAVKMEDQDNAVKAISDHRGMIRRWLFEDGPKPELST